MKGASLIPGQVVVLSLDGTLVYVESLEPTFAGVVALPDQPPSRADERVFTPGAVRTKKISPMAGFDRVVPVEDLTERNKEFIGTYEQLRAQHGIAYVHRTPEELAALEAANAAPVKKVREPKPPKEKKQKGGPKLLQLCAQCGQQRAHICHPGDHEFVTPPEPELPPVLCAACDKDSNDACHTGDTMTHRFIPAKPTRKPRVSSAPTSSGPAEPKPAKASRVTKEGLPAGPFRWAGTDEALAILAAGNPKYQPKNSGAAIIQAIRDGAGTPAEVLATIGGKWDKVTPSRCELAFTQLLAAKLIEVTA